MPSKSSIPFHFPPAPIQTPSQDPSTLSKFSKPWVDWFTAIVNQITTQIKQIIAVSYQPFTQATLPTNLTAADAGVIVSVTDYNHTLQWTGMGWRFGPGDSGGGYIQAFLQAPAVTGWHVCDGSTVKMLNGDGSVSSITLPDYATAAYLKLSKTLSAGPNAASGETAPTDIGPPTGTNSAPTFTGSVSNTGNESADLANVATTGSATAAAAPHTHSFTPVGTVSAPIFSGNDPGPHSHGPGNLELANSVLLPYFRQ